MKPLLTIVIPTHNRSQYAIYSIQSILNLNEKGIELIVSDTSTDGKLEVLVEELELTQSRVVFNYTKHSQRLDMTENHNFSLSQVTGEYVCLIGDDDSVSPELYDVAKWAKKRNIKLITPKVKASYNWPDFVTKVYGDKHCTRLYLPQKIGGIELKNSHSALRDALDRSCQGTDGLPKLYHGLVSSSLLSELFSKTGAYVHGSSPDMSAAIGLAFISKDFYELDYPLTIPGASGGSNTGRSALNKHKGKMSTESQTSAFIRSGWNEFIPKFFSVETVWAHAAVATLEKLDIDHINKFNFLNLYALCEWKHSDYSTEIKRSMESYSAGGKITYGKIQNVIFKYKSIYLYRRLVYIFKRLLIPTAAGGKKFVSGIENVSETPNELISYLDKNGFFLSSILDKKNEGKG